MPRTLRTRGDERRYQRDRRVPPDDLRQVAAIGLLKAIERFDPGRGIDFKRFAAPTINGELKRYLRDFTWAVRPPRGLQERAQQMARERDQLTTELGRSPTPAELYSRPRAPLASLRLEKRPGRRGHVPGAGKGEAPPMHGHRTEPPAPGSPEHEAQRDLLLELVVDPPAAGDAVGELSIRLGHEPAVIDAAIDELAAVGLVARRADSAFATAAALRFELLGLVRA